GGQERLVALYIDDNRFVVEREQLRRFREAIGASRVIGGSEARSDAVRLDRRLDSFVVGRYDDPLRTRLDRSLGDTHDHRLAGDVRQRFSWKARRRVARGDDGGEARGHVALLSRSSYSAGAAGGG